MLSTPTSRASEVNTPDVAVRLVRREALLEVSVFLFLIVPSMALSFFVTRQGKVDFAFIAVSTILRDLALVCLILFFAWRNGEPVSVLGWRSRNLRRDILLGILLYFPLMAAIGWLESLLHEAGLPEPSTPGPSLFDIRGRWEVILAVVLVIVVAVSEETIFRGYLILRLQTVTRSMAAAVVLSSTIFALGHGYEGSLGVVTIGVMGLILSLIYLWRKSLVTPIVLHFLQDFIAIVVVRYLR